MSRPAADAGGERGREGAASHPSPSSTTRGGPQPGLIEAEASGGRTPGRSGGRVPRFGGGPAAPQNPVITDAGRSAHPARGSRGPRPAPGSAYERRMTMQSAALRRAQRPVRRAPLAGDRGCCSAEAEGPAPRVALWACLNMQARRSANSRRPYIVFRSQPALVDLQVKTREDDQADDHLGPGRSLDAVHHHLALADPD